MSYGLALAPYLARIGDILLDPTWLVYFEYSAVESLRAALHEYSLISPQECETLLLLPGDGREIALNTVSITGDLLGVIDVWWPYDSSAAEEAWPPNRVKGWSLLWDNGQPLLVLTDYTGAQPEHGDELRLWYTARHTIDGLDSAAGTTIPDQHETALCDAAAGKVLEAYVNYLITTVGFAVIDGYMVNLLIRSADNKRAAWQKFLTTLQGTSARTGHAWPAQGWKLDTWDSANG